MSIRSSFMVGLSRVWFTAGLILALMAASLGLASPVGAVAGYGDVGEGTWYTDAVQWSTDNGIADIAGFCFGPDTPVSRGETAVWIYNMENRPAAGDRHSFSDVTDASQDDAISWMADNEITTGKSPTTFAPDDTLTRAEAATFLHRLARKPSAPPHSFVDVVAGWQQGGVSWMADTGITTGTSPTTFAPEDTLTRAHLLTFLYRYQGEPGVTIDASTPNCDPVQPDLGVDSPTVDTSARLAGERFTLSAVVRNLGDSRSASTTLRYYQSIDATITTGDTGVGTDSVFGLDAQETGDESISLTAPSTPGTYYYGACVDSVSDESDTTNNCSTAVTVTVRAAPASGLLGDCQDGMRLHPGQACNYQGVGASGQQITVLLSVRNDGAICRKGGPIRQFFFTIESFEKCDVGGFERDDSFRSGITVEKNSDGSWTFHDS